ncbi:MAG: hypothetical protein J6J42_05980 [Lachnospiraceae bacterium]|nr:hypothetical protein [Lachnospiraceae bacterium]
MSTRKTTKWMATLLCMVMLMPAVACGSKGDSTTEATSTPAPTQQAQVDDSSNTTDGSTDSQPEATATPTAEPEPSYDFGGRVVRIGSYYDMTPNPEESALKEALAERIAFVEENYNCDIQFVNLGGDYLNTYITSVLAGEPCCEIGYVMTYKLLPSLIEGGIAYPVSDLGVIDFDDYKWRTDVVEAGYYKGKNYGMLLKDPEIRYGIFWNKTLFEKYGLPNLYELYNKDEWTWDKFKEIAIAGNQDVDKDGTIDIYGFNERESLAWCYLYSNGADVVKKTDTGMEVNLSDPKVVEALTALQDFTTTVDYQHGWLGDWRSQIWNFRDGTALMCLEEYWISYGYLTKAEGGMADEWGWVPFPKGPSAEDWSCYGKEFGGRFMLNGIENPEEVALIYDLITDIADTEEEWNELMEAQLENWAVDAESVENVSYINNAGVGIINPIKGFGDISNAMNNMFDEIKNGSSTPQVAIEKNQELIAQAIKDALNYDYDAEMQAIKDAAEQASEGETAGE